MRFTAFIAVLLILNTAAFAQRPAKPRARASAAAASPTPLNPEAQKAHIDQISAMPSAGERVAGLENFLNDYPDSEHKPDASASLFASRMALAQEKMQSGETDVAAAIVKTAIEQGPTPIPQQIFTTSLAQFPAALFWAGARTSALEIAKLLEAKAEADPRQLLELTSFYMGIESGSDTQRLAEKAIVLQPDSALSYQTLGLAHRMNFRLDESSAAYAKAVELDPTNTSARRSLAEMKRALGRPDEAAAIYSELVSANENNLPAQTGLILALFDAGKRADAEARMARSLEANPSNVILLAGAAYWYAANGEGAKAVEYAERAIANEPRYIWSHIALARGHMARQDPVEAERVLIRARQFGNFPTLEYELASARLMSGLYREAAEALTRSFKIQDGMIAADLGGRVTARNANFMELLAAERRASIFQPAAADNADSSRQLKALLEFVSQTDAPSPDPVRLSAAAGEFVAGDDEMKLHRQLFAADRLLDRRLAIPTVLELTKASLGRADASLDVPHAASAVMASELYETRSAAFARGEMLTVPVVPRQTLSAILRGRIEEITGWAQFNEGNTAEAVVHLKRAVSVLPEKSAWWRSSLWRLGSVLAADGKDADALEAYIKSYRADRPNAARYSLLEELYAKVNGSTDGLEARIGSDPSAEIVAAKTAPEPEPSPEPAPAQPVPQPQPAEPPATLNPQAVPKIVPIAVKPSPSPEALPATEATPEPIPVSLTPQPVADPAVTEAVPVEVVPELAVDEKLPAEPAPSPEAAPPAETSRPEVVTEPPPEAIVPEPSPAPETDEVSDEPAEEPAPSPSPEPIKAAEPIPDTPTESPGKPPLDQPANTEPEVTPPIVTRTEPEPEPTQDPAETDMPEPNPPAPTSRTSPSRSSTSRINPQPDASPRQSPASTNSAKTVKPLFDPIIITIPKRPPIIVGSAKKANAEPAGEAVIVPCTITVSEDSVSIINGGSVGVLVGVDQGDLRSVRTQTSSPRDLEAERLSDVPDSAGRVFYLIRSVSENAGLYEVEFAAPCGKNKISVRVR